MGNYVRAGGSTCTQPPGTPNPIRWCTHGKALTCACRACVAIEHAEDLRQQIARKKERLVVFQKLCWAAAWCTVFGLVLGLMLMVVVFALKQLWWGMRSIRSSPLRGFSFGTYLALRGEK